MNDTFYEMIFKRKSFHLFRRVGNESISEDELNDIQNAYSEFIPLNPEIKTAIHIVSENATNCKRGGEYCVLLYMDICLEHNGIGFEKKLYSDDGEDKEFVLNAEYKLG